MPIALLAPVRARRHGKSTSRPFAQFVREKGVSFPDFVREIEVFAQKEAEQVALKERRRLRLEERIAEMLLEIPDAVISFSLPPFSSRNNQPSAPHILRPALPSFARRVQTLFGAVSILPATFTLPPTALIRIAGVSGTCADLRDYRSPLGRTAFALARHGARPVVLATKDLVLKPVVTVLEQGGYRVRFEFAAGAFHQVEEGQRRELEAKAQATTRLGRVF
ncbi:hypothetical protein JCM10449v2_001602 [Rhodotorula kratochvilovae]